MRLRRSNSRQGRIYNDESPITICLMNFSRTSLFLLYNINGYILEYTSSLIIEKSWKHRFRLTTFIFMVLIFQSITTFSIEKSIFPVFNKILLSFLFLFFFHSRKIYRLKLNDVKQFIFFVPYFNYNFQAVLMSFQLDSY